MIKVLFFFSIFSVTINAYVIKNLGTRVSIEVNKEIFSMDRNEKKSVNAGDVVCLRSANGRLLLKNDNYYRVQLSGKNNCELLPISSKNNDSYFAALKGIIVARFSTREEKAFDANTKAFYINHQSKEIIIDKMDKFIYLESKEWSPRPIYLKIYDTEDHVIFEQKKKYRCKDEMVRFLVDTSLLKKGYKIEVFNALMEEHLNLKVQFK